MLERPPIITLTDAAATRLARLMREGGGKVLRLGLKNAGCAGMSYTLDYAHDKSPADQLVEDKGAALVIAPGALMFLLGTRIDYREGEIESGFVFENPNQTDACGCGESVTLAPAKDMAKDGQEDIQN